MLSAPKIELKKIEFKIDPQSTKLLKVISQHDELQSKVQKPEEIDSSTIIESFGYAKESSQSVPEENHISQQQDKIQCSRCEKWFYSSEFTSHLDAHSTQIFDWLYLGGERNSSNYVELTKRTSIKYILNTATECHNHFPNEFIYHKIYGEDRVDFNILEHFENCIEFIKKAKSENSNILVHCIQGMSRSVSVVLAYLMKEHNQTLKEAYTFVKDKRPIIRPNKAFVDQLLSYEKSLRGINSIKANEMLPQYWH